MWLPFSSHSLTFSLSLSLLHILSWHFWQWGNLLQGSICWCDSHYPLHSHSFCPTFSLTYTRGERGNILQGAICRSDSHSLLILSLTHCFSHSLTFSILTFPQSRWASKYILHSTLILAPTPKIAHSQIKYTTKPIHNKTNTQIHTKNKHTQKIKYTNVQIQNVTHLTNTPVSITVPMSVSIACLSISAYFTRAFFHSQQITFNLLTFLHSILTLEFNIHFLNILTLSFLASSAQDLHLLFNSDGNFRGNFPECLENITKLLLLNAGTYMASCYSAFVFNQKHVFC